MSYHDQYYDLYPNPNGHYTGSERANQDFHTDSEGLVQFANNLWEPYDNSGSLMITEQSTNMKSHPSLGSNVQPSYQQQPCYEDHNYMNLATLYPYPAYEEAFKTSETTSQAFPGSRLFSQSDLLSNSLPSFRISASIKDEPTSMEVKRPVEQWSNTVADRNYQPSHALTDNQYAVASKTKRLKYDMRDEVRREVRSKRQLAARKEILSKMTEEERRDYNRRINYGIPLDKGELTFEDYIQIEEKKIEIKKTRLKRIAYQKMILSTPAKTSDDMEKIRILEEREVRRKEMARRRRIEKKKQLEQEEANQAKEFEIQFSGESDNIMMNRTEGTFI